MKKLFLLTAIAGVFAFGNVSAQKIKGPKLGIGADFAVPVGVLSDGYKFGFGGSLLFQTPIAPKLNFTASAGYLNLSGKDVTVSYFTGNQMITFKQKVSNSNVIPVKVGARYFINDNFYAGAEVGAAFLSEDGDSATAFAYSPNIGYELPLANKNSLDFGVRYEGWSKNSSVGFFGLRVAYNFGL
ncbi:outer membrane beta-barrel protein [Pedobacter cryoconitis]|uniref:Outer membrane protein beta-barrel domain-containing protein n=1 Tax=Pedobacter cryoconitis TaxID=188932 RepID=A0A7X0J879_9SPHI|nr:outer membrane beta-barrel protein [Pedobacter cryoconitis]MBB6502919.1 hypothetical protein [Pedobacter cryoconitis]